MLAVLTNPITGFCCICFEECITVFCDHEMEPPPKANESPEVSLQKYLLCDECASCVAQAEEALAEATARKACRARRCALGCQHHEHY